jgi:hypothetical protein
VLIDDLHIFLFQKNICLYLLLDRFILTKITLDLPVMFDFLLELGDFPLSFSHQVLFANAVDLLNGVVAKFV